MKETNYRIIVRELLKQGLTTQQIVERVNCDSSHAYRLINQEKIRTGVKPVSVDRLTKLEERVRQLEKIVAALAAMKRFGGPGVTASPESQESRLQRLLADNERP